MRREYDFLDFGGGVRLEVEVETDVFGLFVVEVFVDGGFDFFVELSDADSCGVVGVLGEWGDVADLGFNADTIAVFLGSAAGINCGGALEIAEGIAHGLVAAA